jgi:hypothetical protein
MAVFCGDLNDVAVCCAHDKCVQDKGNQVLSSIDYRVNLVVAGSSSRGDKQAQVRLPDSARACSHHKPPYFLDILQDHEL